MIFYRPGCRRSKNCIHPAKQEQQPPPGGTGLVSDRNISVKILAHFGPQQKKKTTPETRSTKPNPTYRLTSGNGDCDPEIKTRVNRNINKVENKLAMKNCKSVKHAQVSSLN